MANLIALQDDSLVVLNRDRALLVAKKLTKILRDDLNSQDVRLHMAQASVAAELKLRSVHKKGELCFARRWSRDLAANALVERGTVPDWDLARLAIDLLEDRHVYNPSAPPSIVSHRMVWLRRRRRFDPRLGVG